MHEKIVPCVKRGRTPPHTHTHQKKGRVYVVFSDDLVGFGMTLACVLAVSLTSGCMKPKLHGYNIWA